MQFKTWKCSQTMVWASLYTNKISFSGKGNFKTLATVYSVRGSQPKAPRRGPREPPQAPDMDRPVWGPGPPNSGKTTNPSTSFSFSEQWRGEQTDKAAPKTKGGLWGVPGKLRMPTTKLLLYALILIMKSSYDSNIHSKSRKEMVQFGKQLMFRNSPTLTLLLYIILIIFYKWSVPI